MTAPPSRATRVLLCLAFALLAWPALAQSDVKGSRDHPMLSRYPGSFIAEYKKDFNAVEFAVGAGAGDAAKRQRVEGNATRLVYFYQDANQQPSPLQVIRNYQNAVKSIGGEVVYERLPREADGGETTLKVTTGGNEVWVQVVPGIFSAPTHSIEINVVEVAAMQQVVTASKMLDEINKNGFVALYIVFDTGKWDLKADGQATVREIVAMMKSAPQLKIAVEGHTDNVGTPAANKTLSENRAKSVMNAIVAGGVEAARLSAAGFGQDKPIADNRSEEGRGKNRRVELVKK
jgi:OmpA-OmpF porin, OOP family